MTTFVPRVGDLPLRSSTFAGVTDAAVLDITTDGVLFDADLDDAAVAAVRERMLSRDDADMAARANLRVLTDAVRSGGDLEEVRALTIAAMDYFFGEV